MIGQETSAVLRDKHVIGGTSVVTLKPLEVRLTGMGHGSIDRERECGHGDPNISLFNDSRPCNHSGSVMSLLPLIALQTPVYTRSSIHH